MSSDERLRRERDEQVLRRQEVEVELLALKRLAREYVDAINDTYYGFQAPKDEERLKWLDVTITRLTEGV